MEPASAVLEGQATDCNSSHHQAADPSALGKGLAVAATSAYGIIEALEMAVDDGRFVSCVQWHPERMKPDQPASGKLRSYWVGQARTAVVRGR